VLVAFGREDIEVLESLQGCSGGVVAFLESLAFPAAYSGLSGRPFRLIPAAVSGVIRPPFPGDGGHPLPVGGCGCFNFG